MTTVSPVQQGERAVIVDIIRGFALAGVLIANFTSYTEQNLPSGILDSISSPLDKTLIRINTVFFEWKFMTLFSILFGYSFGLILTSLNKKNINPTPFFIRRMTWLFVIGFIHTLFWWGDVLHLYAICGILLVLFRKARIRTILSCSILFMFIVPPFISFLFQSQPSYFTDDNIRLLYEQYRYGDTVDVFRANTILYYKAFIVTGADLRDIVETLGRFLFGYFLLRIGLFENAETKPRTFRKVLLITAPFMIAYFIIRWLSLEAMISTKGVFLQLFMKAGILSTSCFYASLLVLLFVSAKQNKFFSTLQVLGKMTLTNYLLISAILIILLYGIGFGNLGTLSMHVIWIFAFAWLIIEIAFSIFWLHKFRYGPAEWIWRQLTYKKRIQLRK